MSIACGHMCSQNDLHSQIYEAWGHMCKSKELLLQMFETSSILNSKSNIYICECTRLQVRRVNRKIYIRKFMGRVVANKYLLCTSRTISPQAVIYILGVCRPHQMRARTQFHYDIPAYGEDFFFSMLWKTFNISKGALLLFSVSLSFWQIT